MGPSMGVASATSALAVARLAQRFKRAGKGKRQRQRAHVVSEPFGHRIGVCPLHLCAQGVGAPTDEKRPTGYP